MVVLAVAGFSGVGAPLHCMYSVCDLETRSLVLLTIGILGKDREFACGAENSTSNQ